MSQVLTVGYSCSKAGNSLKSLCSLLVHSCHQACCILERRSGQGHVLVTCASTMLHIRVFLWEAACLQRRKPCYTVRPGGRTASDPDQDSVVALCSRQRSCSTLSITVFPSMRILHYYADEQDQQYLDLNCRL